MKEHVHVWLSRVTRMHESCHTYERVMSHVLAPIDNDVLYICIHIHVYVYVYMNESCPWMIESCHMYTWVMSHVWKSHVRCSCSRLGGSPVCLYKYIYLYIYVYMNESCPCVIESCHMYAWVMSHVRQSHVRCSCSRLEKGPVCLYEYVCTYKCLFMNGSCPCAIELCHMYAWVMSQVSCTKESCHMLLLPSRRRSCIYVYTHIYVYMYIYVSYVHEWLSRVTCVHESCHKYDRVMSHVLAPVWNEVLYICRHNYVYIYMYIWMSYVHEWLSRVTCMHESCHTYERVMSDVLAPVSKKVLCINSYMNEHVHARLSCVTCMIEWYHIFKGVVSDALAPVLQTPNNTL